MAVTDHSISKILGFDRDTYVEPPRKRQRRNRTIFSEKTIEVLEKAFSENNYPDIKERLVLANQIHEEEARVQVWFQNRRARHRRSKRQSENVSKSSSTKSSRSPLTPIQLGQPMAEQTSTDNTKSTNQPKFSFGDVFQCQPDFTSYLPKPSTSLQAKQHQEIAVGSPSYARFISAPPSPVSPLSSPTYGSSSILRLPLATATSCSTQDFSQSESRAADNRLCFNYPSC